MTRACHIAVRAATGEVFSDDEIDSLLNRMTDRARRARAEAPTSTAKEALAKAASDMTREQLFEALKSRRSEVHAKISKAVEANKEAALPASWTGARKLNAINVGDEAQGRGTSSSIDAEGRAQTMASWGDLIRDIQTMPHLLDRMSNFAGLMERRFDRLIARELARINGDGSVEPTGDAGALHAARAIAKSQETSRQALNAVGAWISKRDGYIARQTHDPLKVAGGFYAEVPEVIRQLKESGVKNWDWNAIRDAAAARAFALWRDHIMPRLKPETFDGLELEDVPFTKWEDEAQETRQLGRREAMARAADLHARGIIRDPADLRELFLHSAWMDIITGRRAEMTGADDEGDFHPKPSLARAVSRSRVFIFKGPDAWVDYNEKFGRSSLLSSVMGQLERNARNTALMRTWGPAPQAAFEAASKRLLTEARGRGSISAVKALINNVMLKANFEQVSGLADVPGNLRFAHVMKALRGWEGLTKLGGIVLSKMTDAPITSQVFKRVGSTWLDGYKGVGAGLLHLGSADAKAAAEALDVGARAIAGHIGAQYMASDGARGWTTWASRLMYRINGFEFVNESVRSGAASGLAAHFGSETAKPWDGLNIGTRETFERFAITPEEWEASRHGVPKAADGQAYLTLDHFERLAAERPKRAATIAVTKLKFAMMLHNALDDVVSEPRARERAQMTLGTKPGTVAGEFLRSIMQFKGFLGTIVGRHLLPASRGFAGVTPAALLAQLMLGTVLAGYVSMNAKTIARGEKPKGPIGDSLGHTADVWSAALAQGGGLGVYGDFLFGELNRDGAGFSWGQLAGPLLSDSEQVAQVVLQSIHGGAISETTGRSQIPGELVKIASRNIPLVNLWYTRLALDYLVLWRLQEAASPGYLARYEDRVRNQEGSDFIVPPTSAAR